MFRELPWTQPAETFARFAAEPYTMFLASSGGGERARYSYLCVAPMHVLRCEAGIFSVDGTRSAGDALARLDSMLAPLRRKTVPGLPPFQGGAAGFLGYEYAPALDRFARAPGRLQGIPELVFGIFDVLFAWDHDTGRLWLLGDGPRAVAALTRLQGPATQLQAPAPLTWAAMVDRETHMARVTRAGAFIRAGDIYQANITASFVARRPEGVDPAALFLKLAAENPAPFSAYIGCGARCAVASVSPERFLQVTDSGRVEARPIKGTRPRGASPIEDEAEAAWLLASPKDRAENLMIVDLLRNDLARVAVAGSVEVPVLCALESFASVHHLVSAITAQLVTGLGPIDLLRAAFPGGSITGAPKIRATEIIAALEGRARGPYCGSAAWIGFDGAMDSSILIRTVTIAADQIEAGAGGGIVADSDPAAEWDELMTKLTPVLTALGSLSALGSLA